MVPLISSSSSSSSRHFLLLLIGLASLSCLPSIVLAFNSATTTIQNTIKRQKSVVLSPLSQKRNYNNPFFLPIHPNYKNKQQQQQQRQQQSLCSTSNQNKEQEQEQEDYIDQYYSDYYDERIAHEEDLTYNTNLRIRNIVTESIQKGGDVELAWEAERLLINMEDAYNVWGKEDESEEEEEEMWEDVVWGEETLEGDDNDEEKKKKEQQQQKEQQQKEDLLQLGPPDTVTYNMVINAYAKCPNEEGSAHHAERILHRMEKLHKYQTDCFEAWDQRYEEGDDEDIMMSPPPRFNVKPNVRTYSTVIDAWARCTNADNNNNNYHKNEYSSSSPKDFFSAAHHAEAILHKLNALYLETKDFALRPNVITYNTVLNAWSKQQQQQHRHQQKQAMEYFSYGNQRYQPQQHHRGTEQEDIGARRATELLSQMESSDVYVNPDVISYNTVMSAWSRCCTKGGVTGGEKAEEILRRMIKNAEEAKAENKRRVEQADEDRKIHYLEKKRKAQEEEGQEGAAVEENEDEEDTLNNTKNKNKRRRKRKLNLLPVIQPNARSYSIVLDAHGKSNHPKSAQRAYSILREMERLYETTHDRRIRPNVVTYSSVMNAYARSRYVRHKGFKALRILRRMEHLYLNREEYANDDEGGGYAVNIVKPNEHCYNAVLNACAMSFGNHDDEEEEDEVDELFVGGELINIRTNPNLNERIVAMQIVKDLYYQMISDDDLYHVSPDHFTYGTILKACANLLPAAVPGGGGGGGGSVGDQYTTNNVDIPQPLPNKNEMEGATFGTTIDPNRNTTTDENDNTMAFIKEVFLRCCRDGMVSSGVCYQLRQAATSELYRELMTMHFSSSSDPRDDDNSDNEWTGRYRLEDNIPKEWSRNVRRDENGRRR